MQGKKDTLGILEKAMSRVGAVVVTHHPNIGLLKRALEALLPQVECLVIVDNGSGKEVLSWMRSFAGKRGAALLEMEGNLGVGAAQNRGIAWTKAQGVSYVLLMDQDAHAAPDMVAHLVAAAERKREEGIPVAAVGPRYLDERLNNPPPFIKVRGLGLQRQPCLSRDQVVEVDYLIASGSLIPLSTLDAVGGMCEELFIDYVDIEWGLRAKRLGYRTFGVCAAHMRHHLGDEPIRFLNYRFPARSPLRHYYQFRNAIELYRRSSLPLRWKLADGWRLVLKYAFYSCFARPRHQHWRMMNLGIWHGLSGRLGKL